MLLLISGCQNSEVNIAALTFINDSLKVKDQELRDSIKLVDSLNRYYQLGQYANGSIRASITVSTLKYCFVLLKATQTEPVWGKNEYFNYCTKVQEYSNVGEDLKYRLMDDAQESYLRSPSGALHRGKVTARECFVFDSYSEASQEREKYLIQQ